MTSKRSLGAVEGQRGRAEIGLAEVAHLADFGFDHPVLADMVEITDHEAGGQAAIDLDAVIEAGLGALDDLGADVGALDANVPAGEQGEMLAEEHGQAIGLLAGGAGGAPEAQGAAVAAGFDEFGQQLGAQQLEGAGVAEEAGFVDGHGLGDGALEGRVLAGAQVADEFIQAGHALVAQQLGEAGFEEVVARGIEHVLREAEDELAQIAVIGAGG